MKITKTKKKRILSLLLSVAMVIGLLQQMTMPVHAAGEVYGVLKSDGLVYETNSDNTKTDGAKITDKKTITNLFVASDVTSISDEAFDCCTLLTTITMPMVTSIGTKAFRYCRSLKTIEMPKVTSMGEGVFAYCNTLKTVEMPEVTLIGKNGFYDCTSLITVKMPMATTIGEGMFYKCKNLTTVTLPEATSIGLNTFFMCEALTTIALPEATSISENAFAYCTALSTVEIPNVNTIVARSFAHCKALANLTVGATPPTVGVNAFYECQPSRTLTIAGSTQSIVALYKAVYDDNITDNLWYGWTLCEDFNAIVNNAKEATEGAGYRNMTQDVSTSEEIIKNALKETATIAINDNSVMVTINKISYTEPVAGTSANPSGTNGSYVFTLTVSKGGQTQTTTQKTIVITATPYKSTLTYDITGTVQDKNNINVSGVRVKLMKGNTPIGSQETTSTNGKFTITKVPNGIYNLIVTKDDITVTIMIIVDNENNTLTSVITLPIGKGSGSQSSSSSDKKDPKPMVDQNGLKEVFVGFPSNEPNADKPTEILTGDLIKNMENKQVILSIKTEMGEYRLPASQIDIDAVANTLGKNVELKDIQVRITLANATTVQTKAIAEIARNQNVKVVGRGVSFEVSATYNDKTVEVKRFTNYVERLLPVEDNKEFTTAVVIDGQKLVQVPTEILMINNKKFAKINSLTNSTYVLVYAPKVFSDMKGHIHEKAVNQMASRLVVSGKTATTFSPNDKVTRGEAIEIITKGLGIYRESYSKSNFIDSVSGKNSAAIDSASAYHLITGIGKNKFDTKGAMTLEQLCIILGKANSYTQLTLNDKPVNTNASKSAQNVVSQMVNLGIFSAKDNFKRTATKAEVTNAVYQLLVKGGLINQ